MSAQPGRTDPYFQSPGSLICNIIAISTATISCLIPTLSIFFVLLLIEQPQIAPFSAHRFQRIRAAAFMEMAQPVEFAYSDTV